jgi:hypothetical protein
VLQSAEIPDASALAPRSARCRRSGSQSSVHATEAPALFRSSKNAMKSMAALDSAQAMAPFAI